MKKSEIIRHFENCFNAMKTADEKSNEAFAWFSGLPGFNIIMHISCDPSIVEKKVNELIQKVPVGNSPSFWVHSENRAYKLEEILKEKGFQFTSHIPIMLWKVQAVKKTKSMIRKALNLDIFWKIIGITFKYDQQLIEGLQCLFNNTNIENYLVYADSKPIGAATLFIDNKIGIISNLAVLPKYRKQGYGRSMMLFLMKQANKFGLEYLLLGASLLSEKLYTDLGFEKILDIKVYTI